MEAWNPYKENCTSYWCSLCTVKKVNPKDKSTGSFFHVFGHEFNTGNYVGIFYALCPDCLGKYPKAVN